MESKATTNLCRSKTSEKAQIKTALLSKYKYPKSSVHLSNTACCNLLFSNYDPYLVLISKVLGSTICQTLRLRESVRAWKPEQIDAVSLLFYLHKPHACPCRFHLCIYIFTKIIAKQVICPIVAAHGGTGGPLAVRHVRKSRARELRAGNWFLRSSALATQGGRVVSLIQHSCMQQQALVTLIFKLNSIKMIII